jgi:NADPH-dependent curcumin reductase CurA
MLPNTNRQIVLAARPKGLPKEADFSVVETPIPSPGPGEILVRTIWLSLDPYMRLRIGTDEQYYPEIPIGDVIVGGAVSRVVESQHPKFKAGDIVDEYTGWQDYAIAKGSSARKVKPTLGPISTAVGVLGMPGLTAYLGFTKVGQPVPGDTVVVSAAAGAVGAVVGQVAKIGGCRVVGIAGSAEKIAYLTGELGFDACVNYKTDDLPAALGAVCPEGIDVYFENVGGAVSEAVYPHLAHGARVVICGGISQYNATEKPKVNSHLANILFTEATVRGFNIFSYASDYERGRKRLARWLKEGRIVAKEEIVEGLENAPDAFQRLFDGRNFGKLLVKVSDE